MTGKYSIKMINEVLSEMIAKGYIERLDDENITLTEHWERLRREVERVELSEGASPELALERSWDDMITLIASEEKKR